MPNITEFDAGNLGLRPSEVGVEAQAAAGRRIGVFYSQQAGAKERLGGEIGRDVATVGQVATDYMAHQEISAGGPSSLQLFSDQLDKKNAAIKSIDPNDPHYGQLVEAKVKAWREEQLEPALQEFAGQFHTKAGQEWAEHFTNQTRQTMFAHSTADIAQAAEIGIHNSARTTVNTATTTVFNDPSMLSNQIDLVEHSLGGLVESTPVKGIEGGKILSTEMERAKESMVKAAVQGAIMKGGNWQAIVNDKRYSQYVNAAEMASFEKAEKVQERALTQLNKSIQLQNRQLAEGNAEAARVKAMDFTHTDPNTGVTTVDPQYYQQAQQVLHSGAPNAAQTYEHMINLGHRLQNPDTIVTDPAVRADLSDRLMSQDKPTTDLQVRQAQEQGKLDGKQATLLLDVIKARDSTPTTPLFKAAVDRAKAMIEGTSAVSKLASGDKYQAFLQQFYSDYLRERNAGTLKPDALDFSNPDSLISQALKPYRRQLGPTIQQNGGVAATPAPAAPPAATPTATPGQMQKARDDLANRLRSPAAPIPRAEM